MKKIWSKPEIDTLDISMTMANPTGGYYDSNYVQNAPVEDDQWDPS